MHLKRKKYKISLKNKILVLIILLTLSIIYVLKLFNEKAIPEFLNYSELEVKRMASLVLNSTITAEIADSISIDDILIITKDNEGNISSIDFNTSRVNNILVEANREIEKNFKHLEKGDLEYLKLESSDKKEGIIYELPSGIIFSNSILTNLLPKIPVRLSLVGNVICRLSTSIDSYGINNALIKVNIDAEVDLRIILPFASKITSATMSTPIIMKVVKGKVPSYYINGYLDTPMVSSSIQNN